MCSRSLRYVSKESESSSGKRRSCTGIGRIFFFQLLVADTSTTTFITNISGKTASGFSADGSRRTRCAIRTRLCWPRPVFPWKRSADGWGIQTVKLQNLYICTSQKACEIRIVREWKKSVFYDSSCQKRTIFVARTSKIARKKAGIPWFYWNSDLSGRSKRRESNPPPELGKLVFYR